MVLLTMLTGLTALQTGSADASSSYQSIWVYRFNGPKGATVGKQWSYYQGKGIGIGQFAAGPSAASLTGTGLLRVNAWRSASSSTGWYSAELVSKKAFQPASGDSLIIKARIDLPDGGQGYWPAFWALADGQFWQTNDEPLAGEVDVLESVDDDPWVQQTFHCGQANNGAPCPLYRVHRFPTGSGDAGWHTYTWVWAPTSISLYVDGNLGLSVSKTEIGASDWTAAFDHPYNLLLDVAVGGSWAGAPNGSSQPHSSMLIDYIRIGEEPAA
jgi:beta-glucanase (GH16 family)